MDGLKIYRRRYIPNEKILLKDDEVIFCDSEKIVTRWNVIKPRKDFQKGLSCYFLDKGFKVSKFLDANGNLVYYYCDIIHTEFDEKENAYTFSDLLADVIIYESGEVKVVDLAEIADAIEEKLIDIDLAKEALRNLDSLLKIIYSGGFFKLICGIFNKVSD